MHGIDFFLILILIVAVVGAVRLMKKGHSCCGSESSCGCGCSGCNQSCNIIRNE